QRRDRRRGGDHRARPATAERSQALEAKLEPRPVDLIEQGGDLMGNHVVDVADEPQGQMIIFRVDPARARQAAAEHGEGKRDFRGNFERGEQAGHLVLRTGGGRPGPHPADICGDRPSLQEPRARTRATSSSTLGSILATITSTPAAVGCTPSGWLSARLLATPSRKKG